VHTAAANLNGNVVPEDIPKGAASDADFIRVFFSTVPRHPPTDAHVSLAMATLRRVMRFSISERFGAAGPPMRGDGAFKPLCRPLRPVIS
jgi:hypothetical protein